MNEFKLIDYIKTLNASNNLNKNILGIGDDAAVLKLSTEKYMLITVDSLIENIHFSLGTTDLFNLGIKAVTVNVSDILSKNGKPLYLLMSVNIPKKLKNIKLFFDGINFCCEKYGIKIIGGDTTSSSNDFCVSITLIGETEKPLMRSAKLNEGDIICISGYTGLSATGYYALNNSKLNASFFKTSIKHHQSPELLDKKKYQILTKTALAGMDNSDGLYFSVVELCEQSGCGCELLFDKIPTHSETKRIAELMNYPIEKLINFGEDYNFVGVFPAAIEKFISKNKNIITPIGIIKNNSKKMILINGKKKKLMKKGYVHK